MTGATLGLVGEGVQRGTWQTAVGVVVGATFVAITSRALAARPALELGVLRGTDARRATLIVATMTIHSVSEGVGVGVAFGDGPALGVPIAVAIAVHNIPEGLAVGLVLVPRGTSVHAAACWSVFSSLPQPLMAVPAFLFVESFTSALAAGLGIAGGAMAWLAAAELLPEAFRNAKPVAVVVATALAAAAMVVLQLALL
jgi:zinc transporter ZupT